MRSCLVGVSLLLDISELRYKKVLANAKKRIERSTKFINKVKAIDLACAGRLKAIPGNATIRKEYVKCKKANCHHDQHGPYYYAYWQDPVTKKLNKKYFGSYMPENRQGQKNIVMSLRE